MSEYKGFDTRVHIRDRKTGKVAKVQPYKLVISGGEQRFFRGGVEFYGSGEPVNKEDLKKMKPMLTEQEKHEESIKASLKAQIIGEIKEDLEKIHSENAKLRQEVEQVTKEKEKIEFENSQIKENLKSGQSQNKEINQQPSDKKGGHKNKNVVP